MQINARKKEIFIYTILGTSSRKILGTFLRYSLVSCMGFANITNRDE